MRRVASKMKREARKMKRGARKMNGSSVLQDVRVKGVPAAGSVPPVACDVVNNAVVPVQGGIMVVRNVMKNHLEDLIPDDKKAVCDGEGSEALREVWKKVHSLDSDMMNIQGILNNSLYAKIEEDGKGIRSIVFCQAYRNGRFSSLMKIPQADVLSSSTYYSSPGYCNRQTPAEKKLEREYLGKFSGDPNERFDAREIIKVLYNVLPALFAEIDDSSEQQNQRFYREVIEVARGLQSVAMFFSDDPYYPLTRDEIELVAKDMKMTTLELLRRLNAAGFLYRTDSAVGYQAYVRPDYGMGKSYPEWRYCIYNLDYFAGIRRNQDNGAGDIPMPV